MGRSPEMLKIGEQIQFTIKYIESKTFEGTIKDIDDVFIKFKDISECYISHDFSCEELDYMVVPIINILQMSKLR